MNEADTRAELIDPKLKEAGWGIVEGSKISREYYITGDEREWADYVLIYKGEKLAVVEAKSLGNYNEGISQVKEYAKKLQLQFAYSTDGKSIYYINMDSGKEELIDNFPTPNELYNKTFSNQNEWRDKFSQIPFEDKSGSWSPRYYQDIAINRVLNAIAEEKQRILLTLATGTGKTAIAFQIAWKLFYSNWNLIRDGSRKPRILFLADRNILADQAFNSFSAFAEDALVRINPNSIKKSGKMPTNGNIFFTIFQTFMTNVKDSEIDEGLGDVEYEYNFGEYERDFFDLIIIDECHRGGANDEGNWRKILQYFDPAVQLGLTATPKKKDNANTYNYFGEPVYVYSLKEGINDKYLTPFRVRRIETTLDEYIHDSRNKILAGYIEEGEEFKEKDFNTTIQIVARERYRVQALLNEINPNEKTLVFCKNQEHASLIRDLINQHKQSDNIDYCQRVTANDGKQGDTYLSCFQDNEKSIPTILTTSHKLSTGVDARNIRNIALMREIKSMIEFKQIIGRGTRLYDGKEYFIIYDFVKAYKKFEDPEWDGEPVDDKLCSKCNERPCGCPYTPPKKCKECNNKPCTCDNGGEECSKCNRYPCVCPKKKMIKIDGENIEIIHTTSTMFYDSSGKPITAEQYLNILFGELPKFFKDEEELRKIWSNPETRQVLLKQLEEAGYNINEFNNIKKIIEAEKSDIFDVLTFIANVKIKPITREQRVNNSRDKILSEISDDNQREFIKFVLDKYIKFGVTQLNVSDLPKLLELKYKSTADGRNKLGSNEDIRLLFIGFQKELYK